MSASLSRFPTHVAECGSFVFINNHSALLVQVDTPSTYWIYIPPNPGNLICSLVLHPTPNIRRSFSVFKYCNAESTPAELFPNTKSLVEHMMPSFSKIPSRKDARLLFGSRPRWQRVSNAEKQEVASRRRLRIFQLLPLMGPLSEDRSIFESFR